MSATGPDLHLLLVPGPGDVFGSYRHWQRNGADPTIPAIAYSAQIYGLVRDLGARLTVISDQPLPPEAAETRAERVEFLHLPPRQGRGPLFHLGEMADARDLARLCRDRGIDAVVLQRKLVHYWPLRLLECAGVPIIVSLHNSLWPVHRAPAGRESLFNRLNGGILRRAPSVICVSDAIRDQVLAVAGAGARAAIHVPQYQPDLRHLWQSRAAGRPLERIIYLGRIEESKGIFLLLEAFEALAEERPALRLKLCGRGSELETLRARVAASPHAARIEVPGRIDGASVFEVLQESDLLVCPTTSHFPEGLAKTPIEAAICGVPSLITTSVPAGALLGGAARTVPVDDAGALRDAMQEMAADPAVLDRMAAATKACIEAVFDPDRSLAAELRIALNRALPDRVPAAPVVAA